jgi:hypothetical protein
LSQWRYRRQRETIISTRNDPGGGYNEGGDAEVEDLGGVPQNLKDLKASVLTQREPPTIPFTRASALKS